VKSGIYLPPFGELADPRRVADLAAAAESSGWDGFFVWDHMLGPAGTPVADAWTTLAAIATATSAIRLGAMVTPLARRRPWVLARQIATLDHLSGGRLVAGIGLGDDGWHEFSAFGEEVGPRERGELLDESLEVLLALLSGEPVTHKGRHFDVDCPPLLPRPVQDPVPAWGACRWPYRRPLARAARLQGCFPIFGGTGPLSYGPAEIHAVRAELTRLGAPSSHQIVVCGATRRAAAAERAEYIAGMRAAEVTWLLEAFGPGVTAAEVEAVVTAAPPAGRETGPERPAH
jgi:alkanesulfonate monooxygenase SsuD/methylene tetrahydromethanopterin reductase-like flavin-dependent oxidoreductase (luciferase family)